MNPFLQRLSYDIPLMLDAMLLYLVEFSLDPNLIFQGEHPRLKELRETVKTRSEVTRDGVAIIPIRGVLARNPHPVEMAFMGVEDSSHVQDLMEQAGGNSNVRGVFLDFDSPGGMSMGGAEMADTAAAIEKIKPVVSWTGGQMASLAYMVGSQASKVIASRSSSSGSIGSFSIHADVSKAMEQRGIKLEVFRNQEGKFKAPGVGGTPLTEDQRSHMQSRVEAIHSVFKESVLAARPQIKSEAMQGQSLTAKHAKDVGLIDAIGDRSFAMSVLHSEIRARGL
jgi:signal peptide peptidase SppA